MYVTQPVELDSAMDPLSEPLTSELGLPEESVYRPTCMFPDPLTL